MLMRSSDTWTSAGWSGTTLPCDSDAERPAGVCGEDVQEAQELQREVRLCDAAGWLQLSSCSPWLHRRFELKLLLMNFISRLIGYHKLLLLTFYSHLQR
jgi:hypothetical protein